MSAHVPTSADPVFLTELLKAGGENLKKCYQCATCSTVCTLTPDHRPFPRKEMLWASWGQRERLLGDPDIWLCHQCGDCSVYCPRGADPAETLAAIREVSIRHYAVPSFLGRLVAEPRFLPLALAIPVVFILAVLALAGTLTLPKSEIVRLADFFPHAWLNGSFSLVFLATCGFALLGASRFWRDLQRNWPVPGTPRGLFESLLPVVNEIITHDRFSKCTAHDHRYLAHLGVFWGFICLLLATVVAILVILLGGDYPMPLYHPGKLLGNVGMVLLLSGGYVLLKERLSAVGKTGRSTYQDILFLCILLTVTVTGGLVQVTRMANSQSAYYLYFIHLVAVFYLLMYLPYSKFAHVLYRTLALFHARRTGRL